MEIIILTDYHGFFGSKWKSQPYRSGYDQTMLAELFAGYGVQTRFMRMSEVQFVDIDWRDRVVLYTSNEDPGYHYKAFIEDVVYDLKLRGAMLVPPFEMLRANNNKTFMEMHGRRVLQGRAEIIPSMQFGALEDLDAHIDAVEFPCVFKTAGGALSRGVRLVRNRDELYRLVKKMCATMGAKERLHELGRQKKHMGYSPVSSHQRKFILQKFIPGLGNDWKVLVYGDQIYTLKRHVRKDDFRASGSGVDYKPGSESGFPLHVLDNLMEIMHAFDVPNLSLDVAYGDGKPYIFEYQGIYYGTSTQYKSKDYFFKQDGQWVSLPTTMNQEEVFVWSIALYLRRKGLLAE